MKDRFSSLAPAYARYRPDYPAPLVSFLLAHVPRRERAWDCGTGNGQFASLLSPHFASVDASDISAEQLSLATPSANVTFRRGSAEASGYGDACFDLAASAQALHWFDHERYYAEIRRVVRPGGIVAAAGYGRCILEDGLDPILDGFYREVLGPHWDPERAHIESHFRDLPFPFHEIAAPPFETPLTWSRMQLCGYLRTWSAVARCKSASGVDPVDEFERTLERALERAHRSGSLLRLRIPYFLRLGVCGEAPPA